MLSEVITFKSPVSEPTTRIRARTETMVTAITWLRTRTITEGQNAEYMNQDQNLDWEKQMEPD